MRALSRADYDFGHHVNPGLIGSSQVNRYLGETRQIEEWHARPHGRRSMLIREASRVWS
jgi:hypothetical protein